MSNIYEDADIKIEKSRDFSFVIDGKKLDVKEDVTVYEAVKLNELTTCMIIAASNFKEMDYEWFIKEHKLERHFKNIKIK